MGQGSSQPERSADDSRPARRASQALRRVIPERRTPEREYEHDGLLAGQQNISRPVRRGRRSSVNRLSQILSRNNDEAELPRQSEQEQQPHGALRRTGSRFHEMLRRDGSHSLSIRPSVRAQRRSSYRRTDADTRAPETPRLPSIDVQSTFEDTFVRPPQPPGIAELDSNETESPQRRPNIRFNPLRPDPILPSFRNLTSSLRRRRSSQPSLSSLRQRGNEDQAAMLSRLLSVAAAATAATLMGDDPHAMSEARSLTGGTGLGDLAGGGEDGSFDGFLRALQNGRIASALRQGTSDNDANEDGSPAPPLNFFRMFRFGPQNGRQPPRNLSTEESGEQGRLVPIIIVGIRSISQGANSTASSFNDELPPFIDALGNFPSPLPAHGLGAHTHESIDAMLRPPQNSTSFRHRRRASMGGFGMGRSRLSDRMDDQRDHRSPDRRRERPWSVASSSNFEPRPPPATPASPSPELSRISSTNSTPNHSRPASVAARDSTSNESRHNSNMHRSSAASPLSSHTEETASLHSTHSATNLLADLEPWRIHRRSDTAPNVHYPRFASGHPRRNGVVEPDNLESLSRTSSNARSRNGSREGSRSGDARSWIIYVLGGSYPENHPILTTPSLFTENPTYEDMMLLSALLGPAKAPVASQEDVQSAGGIYTVTSEEGALIAVAIADDRAATPAADVEKVHLETGQRCLVCLADFEKDDTARKLVKCNHLFHRECIDEWLTTGRNSCPLCREQGVDETKATEKPTEDGAAAPREDAAAPTVAAS